MPRKIRISREVPCPKDAVLRGLLEECEETGRIVIFAAFTGSIDRAVKRCHKEGWGTVRLDGRGYEVTDYQGNVLEGEALEYWANRDHPRVAFIAHPESGGMSLTLTEARMAVFISNTNKPENRIQAEERIHRLGMDLNLGCEIVDIFHLPTDERILTLVRENRRLELLTMGEVVEGIEWEAEAA
jgi:SNF2 family DNA or RNA helicase